MNPRKAYKKLRNTLALADNELVLRGNFNAFGLYQYILKMLDEKEYAELVDKDFVQLYCKYRSIQSQYRGRALMLGQVIEKVTAFIPEIKKRSDNLIDSAYKKTYDNMFSYMQKINTNLNTDKGRRIYIYESAKRSIERANNLSDYAEMMEIDVTKIDGKAAYLNNLGAELRKYEINDTVAAELAEVAGDAYKCAASNVDDLQEKLQLLMRAYKCYSQAFLCWRSLELANGDKLLSRMVSVMKSIYKLTENETDKSRTLRIISSLLSSPELVASTATLKNEIDRQALVEKITKHSAWFEKRASQLPIKPENLQNEFIKISPPPTRRSSLFEKATQDLRESHLRRNYLRLLNAAKKNNDVSNEKTEISETPPALTLKPSALTLNKKF